MENTISNKIKCEFLDDYFTLENESSAHALGRTDSHFKLVLVSGKFEGLSKVKRHQMLYKVLAREMELIHALALHLYTPAEWEQVGVAPVSPKCAG